MSGEGASIGSYHGYSLISICPTVPCLLPAFLTSDIVACFFLIMKFNQLHHQEQGQILTHDKMNNQYDTQ